MQTLAFSQLNLNPFTPTAGKKPPNSTAFRKTPPPTISAVTFPAAFPYKDRTTLLPTLPPEKVQIFKSLESWAFQHVVPLLKPIENSWQPTEFLPNPVQDFDRFTGEVRELRERALELPDDYLVVLVGDLITEDALPTYQSMLNRLDGAKDETGASPSPWAVWTRGWTAEENRHGDLLKTYLYLSGRVDMVMIEKTMHYLLSYGMNTGTNTNPYIGFVYTSFQERATFVSHGNTARLAKIAGDPVLAKICGTIAADEKRHETAYSRIVGKLIQLDPDGVMSAIGEMMRMKITMPGHLMYDGRDPNLFANYSAVAQRLGIYTAGDYADILVFLIQFWGLEKLEGLTAEGKRAQEFVCGLPQRIIRLQEKADERAKKINSAGVKFSWIFDKEICL